MVKEKLLYYYKNERDLRGFVHGKGWAHAAAHGADALDDLALCLELGATDLMDILNTLALKICAEESPYTHEEDERITTAVISTLSRNLNHLAEIEVWIRQLAERSMVSHRDPSTHVYLNVKMFLRSFYFRMQMREIYPDLQKFVCQIIKETSHYNF